MAEGVREAWAACVGTIRLCALLLLGCAFAPGTLAAQQGQGSESPAEARSLFERGGQASDDGRWAEAADLYQRSLELMERPSTMFNLVGVLHRLGRYREGLEVGAAYLRAPSTAAEKEKRAEVERLLADMQLAVGVLELTIVPRTAVLTLDGKRVSAAPERYELAVDPGRHQVAVSAPGYEPIERRFVMDRGGRVRLDLTLVPEAVTASPPPAVMAADETPPALGKAPAAPPITQRQRRVRRALWATGSILFVGGLSAIMIAGAAKDDEKPEPTGGTTGVTLPL